MIKPNPFTPQSGWEPKSFYGRDTQIKHFNNNIREILSTKRPAHMIILGDWGTGKTSLLKRFKIIAQKDGMPSSYCPIPKFTKNDSSSDVINSIAEEILQGFPVIKGFKKMAEEIESAGITLAGFGGQIARKTKASTPQRLLTDILLKLWKHLEAKLAIVLIDDIQNFNDIPQVIDILRLVLSREEIIKQTNYIFILSSTIHGWNSFIDKHDPIGRYFRKREPIGKLNKSEAVKTIKETLKNTGVTFSSEIANLIFRYTNGHPYELQLLCSNLYDAQIKGKITKKQWVPAFRKTVIELGADYFDSLYRKASEREILLLQVFCKSATVLTEKDVQIEIPKIDRKFPVKDARYYIYRLIDKGLLLSENRGEYKIIDKMFQEYLLTVL